MGNEKSDSRILYIQGAGQHEQIMRGLLTGIRLSIANPHKHTGDEDRIVAMVELLEDLMPDERNLRQE